MESYSRRVSYITETDSLVCSRWLFLRLKLFKQKLQNTTKQFLMSRETTFYLLVCVTRWLVFRKERSYLLRLQVKSWFQRNVKCVHFEKCMNSTHCKFSLWNVQNSWFPLKSLSILGTGDWRLLRMTEMRTFWKTLPGMVILWYEKLFISLFIATNRYFG